MANHLILSLVLVLGFGSVARANVCSELFRESASLDRVWEDGVSTSAWLEAEATLSSLRIRENISRPDGLPGAVIAARTRVNPNYYFHWIRDAGLVIDALLERFDSTTHARGQHIVERHAILKKVFDYMRFSRTIQTTETLTGLGEPKVNVDGTSFNEPWGRPQNDSPAIRAISLIDFARILESNQHRGIIASQLYDGKFPSSSLIKRDLEYVATNWKKPSWDVWEEILGDHFYTRMVQRRALLDGARLAEIQRDSKAAEYYREQGRLVEASLEQFWDPTKGYIVATLPRSPEAAGNWGLDNKHTNLDIAVILGLLHGSRGDGFLKFNNSRVMATLDRLQKTFTEIYPINHRRGIPGIAIGRYPEDAFSGADRSGGNPWVLATLAMGEAYYRAAREMKAENPRRAADLVAKGDSFIARVRYHAHRDGSLNEQFHRASGFMHSVEDLTWSYAALLTAHNARQLAVEP